MCFNFYEFRFDKYCICSREPECLCVCERVRGGYFAIETLTLTLTLNDTRVHDR